MKILTANRLDDGAVVYWAGDDAWTVRLDHALALGPVEADAAMVAALADDRIVVAPYFVSLAAPATPDQRVRTRETLRARGPSVRTDYRALARQREPA